MLSAVFCGGPKEVAEYVATMARRRAFDACALPLDAVPVAQIFESSLAVFIVSTTGDGEVPSNMSAFWRYLLRRWPENDVSKSAAELSVLEQTTQGPWSGARMTYLVGHK